MKDFDVIIIDFNQVLFASFFAAVKQHTNIEIKLPMVRHMTMNMLGGIRRRFKDHEVIIASDSMTNWRREYFPHYKGRRRAMRDQSDVDWPAIYAAMDVVRHEISENFPYTHIQVNDCEADDIIGAIVHNQYKGTTNDEKTIIISGDKDFKQLQVYEGVTQYDPIKKRTFDLSPTEAKEFLFDHIIRGDKDDDIPNVLSDDDTFMTEDKRQMSLTKKRIETLQDIQNDPNHKYYRNWCRNQTLIDLEFTPENLQREILSAFHEGSAVSDRSKLYTYFVDKRLSSLLENINDF